MKRKMILAAVLAVTALAPFLLAGAFTNPAANIRWNRSNVIRDNGPIDIWMGEAEDYLDGTAVLPDRLRFGEISAPSGNPATNTGWLYVKDAIGTSTLYFEDDAGTVTALGASTFAGGSVTGDIVMANGEYVRTSTTTAQVSGLQVYDNDTGPAYVDALKLTNGNTPAIVLGSATTSLAVTSTGLNVTTAGAVTGVTDLTVNGTLTLYSNEAATLTHATNGAADDLTISLTGATDSSIILSSAGTGADTISLAAAAGTIKVAGDQLDIDTTNDLSITVTSSTAGEDLLITQVGANDSSIIITAAGTGADAIALQAVAGTLDVDADKSTFNTTDDMAFTVTSSTDGEDLLLTQAGANDSSITLSAAGTGTDAIGLQASAGGVDIDAAATKDVSISGGQVLLASKDNAASAIALTTNVGTSETIVLTNTQGTGAGAITLTATAGGITLSSNAGVVTGDPITGDGTAALGGFLKTVTDDNNGKTLDVAESGTVQTNAGAGGSAAWTLPEAVAGLTYTFVVGAAQELRITPDAGDAINNGGTAAANGEYIYSATVGHSVTLTAVTTSSWVVTAITGTWTEQTPP